MRIQHNIPALNAHNALAKNNLKTANILEKFSSGLKINRAGDDAAGLAISEKMRAQIAGLRVAEKNAQDGISLIQTAEGALNEVHAILQRGRELAVQAANDTNTDEDRAELNRELLSIFDEIENIGKTTEFNTMKVFSEGTNTFMPFTFELLANTDYGSSYDSINGSSSNDAKTVLAKRLHDVILPFSVKAVQDLYGDLTMDQNKAYELDITFVNQGKGGSVAYVISGVYPNGDSYPTTLAIDLDDVLSNDPLWVDVDRMIMHEMVHAVMSASMINWKDIPDWFKEGTAEYVAGANERVRSSLDGYAGGYTDSFVTASESKQNEAIGKVLNAINGSSSSSHFYSAGFLATGYLDHLIQEKHKDGDGNPTKTIANFMQDLSNGKSFDQAIFEYTGLANRKAFLSEFTGAKGVQYVKDLNLYSPDH